LQALSRTSSPAYSLSTTWRTALSDQLTALLDKLPSALELRQLQAQHIYDAALLKHLIGVAEARERGGAARHGEAKAGRQILRGDFPRRSEIQS
jgi:hypothetical protein